jgi:hypothetical protein
MKEKIMKLSVLVGIPVMALFIMVGMASADRAFQHHIKGVYAVTGLSACSPLGSETPVSPGIFEGDYTFRTNGTGSINGVIRNLPPGPNFAMRAEFEYTVTKEGRIEFQYLFPPGGLQGGFVDADGKFQVLMTMNAGPSHGVISPDGKTITISCGPQWPLWQIDIDNNGDKIEGTDMQCVTSYTGVRIR